MHEASVCRLSLRAYEHIQVMESAISILKVAGTMKRTDMEVCARGDAAYDQAKGRVFIALDSFTRPALSRGKNHRLPAAWLPERKHVTQDLPRECAVDFANNVFRNWLQQVRESIPSEIALPERSSVAVPKRSTSSPQRTTRSAVVSKSAKDELLAATRSDKPQLASTPRSVKPTV